MSRVFYLRNPRSVRAGSVRHSRGFSSTNLPDSVSVGGEGGGGASGEAAASALPCQDSNNCTKKADWNKLATNHRKTAHALKTTVENLVKLYGIDRLGFFTLTFADHVIDAREASKRFHSLATHVLDVRYSAKWVKVFERQKSGRIHYHLLLVLPRDIRTGVNFDEFAKGNYRSANNTLKAEWNFWGPKGRDTARRYGFGRTELLPIKSTVEAISNYVGKYIAKHIEDRVEGDKGVRLVSYGKGLRGVSSANFGWESPGARLWRRKLKTFCEALGYTAENYRERLLHECGSKWPYHLTPFIQEIRYQNYAFAAEALLDWPELRDTLPEEAIDVELGPERAAIGLGALKLAVGRAYAMMGKKRPWRPSGEAVGHDENDATSTQRETIRSEHCQGGDFPAEEQAAWVALARKIVEKPPENTTLISAT